ncbi:MAG: hypothetical protein ACYS8Z_15395 [Planctomycetota bacterium]|jgi:hypothetical protein
MSKPNPLLLNDYHRHARLVWVGGDLTADEKRIQDTFGNKHLRLRWHVREKNWQVWYEHPNGLTCLLTIEDNYSPAKVEYILRGRQKRPKELRADYVQLLEDREKERRRKKEDLCHELYGFTRKQSRARVTSSTGGKRRY